jgi:hypothetical protein
VARCHLKGRDDVVLLKTIKLLLNRIMFDVKIV